MSNANANTHILVVCPNGESVYIANPSYIQNCNNPAWEKTIALRDSLNALKDREIPGGEAPSDERKFGRRLDGTEYYVYPGIGVPQQVPPQDWGGWRRWKIDLESAIRSLMPDLDAEYVECAQRVIGKQELYEDDIVTCLITRLSFTRDVAEAMPKEDRVKHLRTLPDYQGKTEPTPPATQPQIEKSPPQAEPELQSCWRLAKQSFDRAVNAHDGPQPKPLQQVHKWLEIHDRDDYQLPAFRTWAKYLRSFNNAVDGKKNTPRGNRKGRSMIEAGQK